MRVFLQVLFLFYSSFVFSSTCTQIAEIRNTDGGIFALESFKGDLYIGMFGYDYAPSQSSNKMIYRYDGESITGMNLTKRMMVNSESVCSLKSWKGHLYAGTERAGELFRSFDGRDWQRLDNKGTRDICSFVTDGRTLVAVQTHGGNILITIDGVNWSRKNIVASGNPYFREGAYYNGFWYVFGIQRTNNKPIAYRSKDLKTWAQVKSTGRAFRHGIKDKNLVISQARTPSYTGNETISLNIFDGKSFLKTYSAPTTKFSHLNKPYLALVDGKRRIIATASTGFKPRESLGTEGGGALLQFTEDGKYISTLCEFPGQEYVEATAFHNGKFYIGTMSGGYESIDNRGGGFGRLYVANNVSQINSNSNGLGPLIKELF